jgi:DNA invertase Pin-like site-specific DNA recombinase
LGAAKEPRLEVLQRGQGLRFGPGGAAACARAPARSCAPLKGRDSARVEPHILPRGEPMTSIGYARVSRSTERIDQQVQRLEAAGCTTLFSEIATGPSEADWPQRAAALQQLGRGDLLIVTAMDRLALSLAGLGVILAVVSARGAGLRTLASPVWEARGPEVPVAHALVEGLLLLEANRPREQRQGGIDRARLAGAYRGRKPSVPVEKVIQLDAAGLRPIEIARRLRVGRSSVYRILRRRDV